MHGVPSRLTRFFDRYKRREPGKFSRESGWDTAADGLACVRVTHLFFQVCREATASPCEPSAGP